MAEVAALARYPVKGLTPEPQDALVVQPDGRAAGDRVLAFRFADATLPETRDGLEYWPKQRGLALLDFPSLARLRLTYDHEGRRLRITDGDRTLVEAGLWDGARRRIADAVTAWVLATPEGPLLGRPGRLPLELVGDGAAARFQDRPRGFVTLHSRASVRAVGSAVPSVPVDDRRFRSNIVIDGVPAWQELEWAAAGAEVTIGGVRFTVTGTIERCLAIAANPETGRRDAPLLKVLTAEFAQDRPTLGVLLLPTGPGGTIRVGDPVVVH
jgi:uncharacterized protein YcbX